MPTTCQTLRQYRRYRGNSEERQLHNHGALYPNLCPKKKYRNGSLSTKKLPVKRRGDTIMRLTVAVQAGAVAQLSCSQLQLQIDAAVAAKAPSLALPKNGDVRFAGARGCCSLERPIWRLWARTRHCGSSQAAG